MKIFYCHFNGYSNKYGINLFPYCTSKPLMKRRKEKLIVLHVNPCLYKVWLACFFQINNWGFLMSAVRICWINFYWNSVDWSSYYGHSKANSGLDIFIVVLRSFCSFVRVASHAYCSIIPIRLQYFLQELLTRHKSTVAEFLSKNYDWVIDLVYLSYCLLLYACKLTVCTIVTGNSLWTCCCLFCYL